MDTGTRGRIAQQEVSFVCEHCAKAFKRENTLSSHFCEPKRRWQDRNTIVVQLALEAYRRFYRQCQPSQKEKDWSQFAASSYYTAFVRFAKYMLEVKCVNTSAFIDYVIKQNVKLDHWAKDSVYEQFLLSWIKTEDPWDAVKRSLLTAAEWAEQNQSAVKDYFRYASAGKIILDLDRAQISPWLIFCSATGVDWLSKLNSEQVGLIFKWIDPTVWQDKINKDHRTHEIRAVLNQVGI